MRINPFLMCNILYIYFKPSIIICIFWIFKTPLMFQNTKNAVLHNKANFNTLNEKNGAFFGRRIMNEVIS